MTRPRRVLPGTTWLVTRRCFDRAFLLVPTPEVNEAFGYCLAVAVERHGMLVHGVQEMRNHWHAVLTDPGGNASAFLQDFHGLVARCMNAYLGRQDSFWSGQRPSLVHLVTGDDVLDKLVYTLTNPVSAELVTTHRHWPGFHTVPESCTHKPRRFKRPRWFFRSASSLPEEATLRVTVPPQFGDDRPHDFAQRLAARVKEREAEQRADARAHGRSFPGAARARAMPTTTRGTRKEEPRRLSPELACRCAERRRAELEALGVFRSTYREAWRRWRSGDRNVTFPAGTVQMQRQHGVPVHPPPPLEAAA